MVKIGERTGPHSPTEESIDLEWQDKSTCRGIKDPDVFFVLDDDESEEAKASRLKAKFTCGRCAVREACLDYALQKNERFGIWGGKTTEERKKLKRNGLYSRYY